MRCCCGKYEDMDADEVIVHNNKVHQILGPPGNFCGPYDHYLISILEKSRYKLENSLKDVLFMLLVFSSSITNPESYQEFRKIISFVNRSLDIQENENGKD